MFKNGLPHKFTIIVPSTQDVREVLNEADAKHYVQLVLTRLAIRFGGATALPALGAWVSADGSLVEETITIVYSFSSTRTSEDEDYIEDIATWLRDKLAQEAIAVELDGELHFV